MKKSGIVAACALAAALLAIASPATYAWTDIVSGPYIENDQHGFSHTFYVSGVWPTKGEASAQAHMECVQDNSFEDRFRGRAANQSPLSTARLSLLLCPLRITTGQHMQTRTRTPQCGRQWRFAARCGALLHVYLCVNESIGRRRCRSGFNRIRYQRYESSRRSANAAKITDGCLGRQEQC